MTDCSQEVVDLLSKLKGDGAKFRGIVTVLEALIKGQEGMGRAVSDVAKRIEELEKLIKKEKEND